MSEQSGEKTEEPTHKKLQDARKKGQVWKSKDLGALFAFIIGFGTLKIIWPMVEERMARIIRFAADEVAHSKNLNQSILDILVLGWSDIIILSIPIAFGVAMGAVLVDILVVGPLFTMEPLMPKLDKLNPIQGAKNLFSKKQLIELPKSILKISITSYVVIAVVRDDLGTVVQTVHADTRGLMEVLGVLVFRIIVRVALLFVLFAVFDLWFQRQAYMKDMMMTKDEVKKEYKESEGDPHHKAKRKELHQEILEGAQVQQVRKADVVVTNPTHLAIALQYDRESDQAPKVVCKGMNSRAELIRDLAREGQVPILRNVPLAQALYRVDAGQEIPEDLYDAVAEVLNFVYQVNQGRQAVPLS